MAELLGPWQTAVDANLNALPGALLHTYDSVATNTPKATYADPELTVPHANPIVANGSGQFPQIFAEVGQAFYLVLDTAAGVLVRDFEAVEALGSTGSGTFTRDFGVGGRWQVRGVAGEVNEEFGPPEGDDVGGDGRIGGWDGTQGDSLEVDFAITEFTGAVKFNGTIDTPTIAAAVPVALLRGTVTAQTVLTIPLNPAYNRWQLIVSNYTGSATGTCRVVFSYDGGSSYKTGGTDYIYQILYQTNGTAGAQGVTTAAHIQLTNNLGTTDLRGDFVLDILNAALQETRLLAEYGFLGPSPASNTSGSSSGSTNNKGYGKATNVRLNPAAGNFTFDYVLIGMP